MKKNQQQIDDLLTRAVANVYPSLEELRAAVEKRKLTIYHGIDPTAPTLHIGHGVILKKLRDFQRLGHRVILMIGDFTAQIGDPTDKLATRKQLTHDEVLRNCRHYQEQAARFLDFTSKENPVELRFNSEWLNRLSIIQFLSLASEVTTHQLLTRDMFRKRIEEGKDLRTHEFLYPLLQGYDSVALNVDMEIGGSDQTFNMLVGRDLMKHRGKEKFVLAMKLLVDPTGKKMGKTEGNMITLEDSPEDMYGKVMAWGDGMIVPGFELCTDVPMEEVTMLSKQLIREEVNPRDVKMRLARETVTLYHGGASAKKAEAEFVKMFQKHEVPNEVSNVKCQMSNVSIIDLLVEIKLATSKGEARRLIEQKGVKVDERVIDDPNAVITLSKKGVLIQKGKRHFVRVKYDPHPNPLPRGEGE